jgi:hypothetical protein
MTTPSTKKCAGISSPIKIAKRLYRTQRSYAAKEGMAGTNMIYT